MCNSDYVHCAPPYSVQYTARSRLLEQHPRIGHLLMAMLSQLQVVLRLVIVDLSQQQLTNRGPTVVSRGARGALRVHTYDYLYMSLFSVTLAD